MRESCLSQSSEPSPATGSIELEVRDETGRLPQGNMFPVLTHIESSRSWRLIRYARAFDGLLFRDLPSGRFRLRVASPRHEIVEMEIELAPGGCERIPVKLIRRARRERLIIDVSDEAADLSDADNHPASWLLASLLGDRNVRRAVEAPLDALTGIDASERHHAHRLLSVGFPVPQRPLAERLFWNIVDRRCRLEALLCAAFSNQAVAEMLVCDLAKVATEARTAVDGLDRLDVADALMMLALYCAPWKAVMAEVCRTQAGIRDVLIPAGLADLLRPDTNPAIPARSSSRGRAGGELSDQTISEAGPLLAKLALVIAGASELRPAYLQFLEPVLGNMRGAVA